MTENEQPTRTVAHIVTADAVALGDPEVIVMTGDEDGREPRVIERHPLSWNAQEFETLRPASVGMVMVDLGWRPLGEPTEVETGYLIVDVERIP